MFIGMCTVNRVPLYSCGRCAHRGFAAGSRGIIVEKMVNMANMIKIPVLGLMKNMNYVVCPDYEKEIDVLVESNLAEIAQKHKITLMARLPIDLMLAAACDAEIIELFDGNWA